MGFSSRPKPETAWGFSFWARKCGAAIVPLAQQLCQKFPPTDLPSTESPSKDPYFQWFFSFEWLAWPKLKVKCVVETKTIKRKDNYDEADKIRKARIGLADPWPAGRFAG